MQLFVGLFVSFYNAICVILHCKIIIKIYLFENKEVTLLMQLNW